MCARSLQNRALRSKVERDPTARPTAFQRRSIIEQGDDLMIPTMPFGRTGHQSTRVIFGAAAFSDVPQEVADRTMQQVLDWGITHIDTAASYGDAELRLGPWMPQYRDRFFLATKTGERKAGPAYDEIQRSLERLQTDHVDLIQLHNLVDETEWETAMGPGGALEAVVRARDEGLARFIGVTGHGVTVARQHLRSLGEFDFDAVLLPYSYMLVQNPAYAADFAELSGVCAERNVAMQTIKSITRSPWGDATPNTSTWYKPLEDQTSIDLAVQWVLGNPQVFLNTASDVTLLPKIVDAAERFETRPTDVAMDGLVRAQSMEPLFV
jgi:predicted aldo/keto reductase-like oxidoreductase